MNDAGTEPHRAQAARLIAAAKLIEVELSQHQARKMLTLLDLLSEWNTRVNLTAIRERRDMVLKHLLDSLTVQPYLRGPLVIDVGTGAGFPGLPLAISCPLLRFVLLDSTAKKLAFVSHAVKVLELQNVEVVHARAEDYKPAASAATVVSRALGSLSLYVAQAGALCASSGRLLAMKGRYPDEEIAALPPAWTVASVERLKVPGLDQERHLVILKRRH